MVPSVRGGDAGDGLDDLVLRQRGFVTRIPTETHLGRCTRAEAEPEQVSRQSRQMTGAVAILANPEEIVGGYGGVVGLVGCGADAPARAGFMSRPNCVTISLNSRPAPLMPSLLMGTLQQGREIGGEIQSRGERCGLSMHEARHPHNPRQIFHDRVAPKFDGQRGLR